MMAMGYGYLDEPDEAYGICPGPGRRDPDDDGIGDFVLDLFSGTRAATAPWARRGYNVICVDNDPRTRPDILADVRALPIAGRPIFIWASPPCQQYSLANQARRPDLSLWEATLEVIRELAPRFWVIENVRGACRYWGIPAARWGPWFIWANFRIRVPRSSAPPKMRHRDPAERARIPTLLANAVYRSWSDERRSR